MRKSGIAIVTGIGLMGLLSSVWAMESREVFPRALSLESEAGRALGRILGELQEQYGHQRDNNWISLKMLDTPVFERAAKGLSRTQIAGEEEYYFAISECLLLWRGAYGVHLTPDERHRLAKLFAPRLDAWARAHKRPFGAVEMVSYDARDRQPVMADYDILNSHCTLGFALDEGVTVLADSHGVD